MECIKGIGCGISGRGSVEEELEALTPVEVERAKEIYSSLPAVEGGESLAGDPSGWPQLLSWKGLTLFRYEDARKLIEEDREAMSMAFDASELDDPFVLR
jgi:hypothetical protein